MHYFFDENLTRAERVKKNEEEILAIIKDYWAKNKHSPSVRDIVKKSNVRSNSTVMNYLHRLKNKGLIDWEPKRRRTLYIIDTKTESSAG